MRNKFSLLFVLLLLVPLFQVVADEDDIDKNALLAMSTKDYPVTAGDIYQLSFIAGGTPVVYYIPVDTSYKVRVANLAVLSVKGRTFAELKEAVEQIVSNNFPMSGVQFVLRTPGNFYVKLQGEVDFASDVRCWGLTRLFDVVSEHLTDYSSLRNVEVESISGEKKTYDVFKGRRFSDFDQNPYVKPGDKITLSKNERKVRLSGEVKRAGIYSLLADDSLKDLISLYGDGFTDFADKSCIEVSRSFPDTERFETVYLYSNEEIEAFQLQNNDRVSIRSIYRKRSVIFLEGAVSKLEETSEVDEETSEVNETSLTKYRFSEGETYGSFVRNNSRAFDSSIADIENAYIVRGDKIIPLDIRRILYDAEYTVDELLVQYDKLVVPFKQYFVTVAGAVNKPGRYPYIPDRDWSYYVGLAGGFVSTQNSRDKVKIIDVNGKKHSKNDAITPETTITASANSFTYYWGIYAPVFTVILSSISTICTIAVAASN